MTIEHGDIQTSDHLPADPLGRGNHGAVGFDTVVDEAARDVLKLAILATPTVPVDLDNTRMVYQSGGTDPGMYVWDVLGSDFWFLGSIALNPGTLPAVLEMTTTARTLFLDASRPDDSGDGLTLATAKKTDVGIQSILPFGIFDQQRILVSAGTYKTPEIPTKSYVERLIYDASGALVVDIAQAAAGADTDIHKVRNPAGGMTPSAHRGKTLRMDDGPAADSFRQIADNDADFYFIDRRIGSLIGATAPSPGDLYTILTNTVIFEQDVDVLEVVKGDGPASAFATLTDAGVAFINISWGYDGSSSFPRTIFNKATVWFYGCNIIPTGIIKCRWQMSRGVLYAGADDSSIFLAALPVFLGLASGNEDWAGYGLAELGSSDTLALEGDGRSAYIKAWVVMGSLFINREESNYTLMGRLYGGGFLATLLAGSGKVDTGNSSGGFFVIIGDAGSPICIQVFDSGNVHTLGGMDFRPFGGDRYMLAEAGARITETDIGNKNIGTAGSAVVVEARFGGFIHFNFPPNYDGTVPGQDYVAGGLTLGKADLVNDGDGAMGLDGARLLKVPF